MAKLQKTVSRYALSCLSLLNVGFLLSCVAPARAQQFSADLVVTQSDGVMAPAGKLRVFDGRVRIETPELADGFFIIDSKQPAATFVRPAARVFMDARQSSRLTRLFVPVDPADPCQQWQAMAKVAGVADRGDWRCEQLGQATIDEHDVIAYRAVSAPGREFLGWIDPARKFPLRIKTGDGGVISAQNVRDEPLTAEMFEIPSGFRKFDPQILLRRIKQSDLWVGGQEDLDASHP
jgi:hypothetical protein